MLARFLHDIKVRYSYENHRSKTYQEIASGMGVHSASPQLYAYKKEKLQELEQQYREGLIDLYFGDGSFTCTEGYVLYGWQFPDEKSPFHLTGAQGSISWEWMIFA